jgi:hypothetical protein
MKNILKLGSIALALPFMLTPLGHAQQWSSEESLGGDPNSLIAPIQVPGTNILQIFYQGTDNAIWTQWRNNPDGWTSGEVRLGGQLYSGSTPIAIQLPGTNTLELFYRGADNALWTLWRNPADGNTPPSWSNPLSLGGTLAGDPAVAQIPGENTAQIFYQSADNSMHTRWLTNGTWSSEVNMGGSLFTQTCDDPTNPSCYGSSATPVPIQIPNTNDLEVFYRGSDNHLRAFIRIPGAGWTPQDFGGNLASDPSAAPVPGTNQIEVFYQGGGGCASFVNPLSVPACMASGGGLMTQWGNLSSWTHETQMAGHLGGYWCSDVVIEAGYYCAAWQANYAAPKAYTQPGTNDMFVIYPGADGGIWASAPTLWGQERTPDGTWHSEFNLGTYSPSNGAGASEVSYAQVPGTNDVQIFYAGFEFNEWSGSVYNVLTKWTTQ